MNKMPGRFNAFLRRNNINANDLDAHTLVLLRRAYYGGTGDALSALVESIKSMDLPTIKDTRAILKECAQYWEDEYVKHAFGVTLQ